MSRHEHQPELNQAPDDPIHSVDAVPTVNRLPDVDTLTAHAASLRLVGNNPGLGDQIESHVARRAEEIMKQLEKDPDTETYRVSRRNILAIVSGTTREMLGLFALGLGDTVVESRALQCQFDGNSTNDGVGLITDTSPELEGGV